MRTQHILARSVAAVSILTTGVIGAAEQSASASTPTSATATSTAPTTHATASRFKLAGNTTGITPVSETDYSDGTALGTWTRAGVTYSASGPTGTVVTFTTTTVKDNGVSKVIPEIAVAAPVDRASKARGIGQASAAFIAADPKMAKAIAAKTNAAKANATPASSFLNSPCASVKYSGSAHNATFCDSRQLLEADGNNWYTSDSMTGTAYNVHIFEGYIEYWPGDRYIQWSPNSSFAGSNCSNMTWSFTVFGASISSTSTSCPGAYAVIMNNNSSTYPQYGQEFVRTPIGDAADTGLSAVDEAYCPANANCYPTIYAAASS